MRLLRCFRISVPKTRRILYIVSLLLGLYFVVIFVLKIKGLKRKTESNGATLSYIPALTSHANSSEHINRGLIKNRETFKTNKGRKKSRIHGFLNVHTWAFACELSLREFLENPLFPISPNAQTFVDNMAMNWKEQNSKDVKNFGRRIFGFISPPYTGNYLFNMSTNNNAELWLSRDDKWGNMQLVCNSGNKNGTVSSSQEKSIVSDVVHLDNNHFYFLEIIQTQVPQNSFHLTWKIPHSKNFEEISKKYLYSFMEKSLDFHEFINVVPLTPTSGSYITSHPKHSILSNTEKFPSGVKYIEWSDVKLALPLCPYQPGYVGKRVLYEYHVVERLVNPSYVYPEVSHVNIKDGKWIPWFLLSEKEAMDVVNEYMKHLEDKYQGKYNLKAVLNVERKPDWHRENQVFYKGMSKHGDRFLLELLLWDEKSNGEVILSEYIYQHEKSKKLCYPEGVQWSKTAPVFLLISVRKQAAWVWHFIKNIERLYQSTADENFHVVVYDYNSTDIDIEAAFRQSSFKNYKVLKYPDSKYSRTFSLNRAAEVVKDPNAIVFTLDLHLEIPPSFPSNVRKHCIKGKMVFTPVITRLACGASPRYPGGAWDPWGYGMFGAYKTDWDKIGGFDEVKFKTKWGGEDWDLVSRAYKSGLEFERIKHADFYHYDHSRVGMWT